jgi:predicted nucleic acid-binding protein
MKVTEALRGLSKIFFDTAPIIYYVQATPEFFAIVDEIFTQLETKQFQAITSPVSLAECLVLPRRLGQVQLEQAFVELLTDTEEIEFIALDAAIGQIAADLRVRYNLKLPDALQIGAAISSQCDGFLTNDVQLKRVTELRVLVIGEMQDP